MSVTTDIGRFGIAPLWLLEAKISDRAIRLFALMWARWGDREEGPDPAMFPSRQTLAAALGCSVDSIDRALRELKKAGALDIEARYNEAGQRSNLYRLHAASPSEQAAGLRPSLGTAAEGPLREAAAHIQNHSDPEEQPAREPAAAGGFDGEADQIARAWWESQTPRPLTPPFLGARKIVKTALKAGWKPDQVRIALDRLDGPLAGWRLQQMLERISKAQKPAPNPTPAASRSWMENG